jgi:hypothetical protein
VQLSVCCRSEVRRDGELEDMVCCGGGDARGVPGGGECAAAVRVL